MVAAYNRLCRSAWLNVIIFLVYLLLTLVMTWPLVTRLSSEIAGVGTDVWIHQWTFWWVKQALLNGDSPFFTTLLYYPNGVSLTSHNIAWFNIALWLPLQAIFDPVIAYNLVFILVITLNGFVTYLFARAETGVAPAAFVGGLIFGFWPYTLSHFDHPNMMVTFWVPLTMLFLLRTFRGGRVIDAVVTGVSLALIGITRWQLLVMSAPLLLAYGLYLFYREPGGQARRTAALLILALGLGALLMVPLGMPLVLDQLGRSGPEAVAFAEPDDGLTDLFAYVAPPDLYRAVWNEIPDPLPYPEWEPYHRISASAHYVPFIGLVTLLLVLYGLLRRWPQTWFWLLVALGFMIMALGPVLAINEQRYVAVPMPYRLISDSLLDALIRRPHRLNNFLGLPVAMIATWGLVDIAARISKRWENGRGDLYALLTLLFLGAIILRASPIPPLPTTETTVPQWYRDLAADEEQFAILEIPFHNRGFDKVYMYYQTVHGKPILVGHVSRLPQDAFAFLDSVPFLEPLKSIYTWDVVDESWVDFADVDVSRQLGLLADENVRYIVLNKPLIPPGFVERWRDWVTFNPVYEDNEVLVYQTAPHAGESFAISQPLADGVGLIRASITPQEAIQGGVVKVDLRWATDGWPEGDYQACFSLRDVVGDAAITHCLDPVYGWPTSAWGKNAVARGSYVIPIAVDLPPGAYTLDLTLADQAEQDLPGESAALGEIVVAPFAPQHVTEFCWEQDLCLQGYDLERSPGALDLALYWQASSPTDESYKRFVHLIDHHDGRVVAQSDAIPRDWTYPTDIWEPGEIVADRLALPIDGIDPGTYEIRTGWYTVDGEQRLPICPTGECREQSEPALTLTTVTLP